MNNNFFRKLNSIIFTIILVSISIIPFVTGMSFESYTNFKNQYAPLNMDWWPMFHHDADQNGFSTSSAPETHDVLWSYQTDNLITTSPNVINGKVYIGSLDKKF